MYQDGILTLILEDQGQMILELILKTEAKLFLGRTDYLSPLFTILIEWSRTSNILIK